MSTITPKRGAVPDRDTTTNTSLVTRTGTRKGPAMKPCRYKNLMSYLPGMASVVNAFQSAEVQAQVYVELFKALEMRLEEEGVPAAANRRAGATELKQVLAEAAQSLQDDLEHDLEDGDNIHSAPLR
jgi:hypothetical protein